MSAVTGEAVQMRSDEKASEFRKLLLWCWGEDGGKQEEEMEGGCRGCIDSGCGTALGRPGYVGVQSGGGSAGLGFPVFPLSRPSTAPRVGGWGGISRMWDVEDVDVG